MSANRVRELFNLAVISSLFFISGNAESAGVVRCDNCTNPSTVALNSGVGATIVVDFSNRTIKGYDVEYDRELRRHRALPTSIPSPIQNSFLNIMRMIPNSSSSFITPQADGGVVQHIYPDNPGNINGISFPEAFKNANAYDIVTSSSLRSSFEQQIASEFAGATTNSPIWNSLAHNLTSFSLSFLGNVAGSGTVTYVIVWRDNSRTVLRITPDSTYQAKYVSGESKDPNGNKIPDSAATDPATAGEYVGEYYFSDHNSLNEWINAARLYGVPITDGSGGGGRMNCSWDGRTLSCMVY